MHISTFHESRAGTKTSPTGHSVRFEVEDQDARMVLAALETHQRGELDARPPDQVAKLLEALAPLAQSLIGEIFPEPKENPAEKE